MDFIPNGISVVIPTYNRAHLIKESLQSVLEQTLQPLEIIVVDDFSTDNTEEVVKSLNSPLIKYMKNQRTKGANGARNTGIFLAQGEYIAFHDSDDIWLSRKLELQKRVFDLNENIGLCFCSLRRNNIKNNIKNNIFPKKHISNPKVAINNLSIASTQTILIKREVALYFQFDENIGRFQDWDFVLSVIKFFEIYHLNEVLVEQRICDDSISSEPFILDKLSALYKKHKCIEMGSIWNKIMILEAILERSPRNFVLKSYLFFLKIKQKFNRNYM